MAIYTYRCKECGRTAEVVQSIRSYCEQPRVPYCDGDIYHDGGLMERYLTGVMITFDHAPWAAYRSPIDGQPITSRAEQREHMAKHGVALFEDVKPDIERNRKRIVEEQKKEIKKDLVESLQKVEAGYEPTILPEAALIPT